MKKEKTTITLHKKLADELRLIKIKEGKKSLEEVIKDLVNSK